MERPHSMWNMQSGIQNARAQSVTGSRDRKLYSIRARVFENSISLWYGIK